MLHLHDRATMAHALTLDLEPQLKRLLTDRIAALGEELLDWTEYLIVQPGDTEADIVGHVGFSPLVDPIDGARFGEPGFHPGWEWIAEHDGWFELIVSFGSTFALVMLIARGDPNSSEICKMCAAYADAS